MQTSIYSSHFNFGNTEFSLAGLIILVHATYERFTDIMKIIGIFCLSSIILAVGLFGKWKSKNSAFFISLTGCGAGAIYLSIFLMHSYFGYINVYVLFLLLTVCLLNGR